MCIGQEHLYGYIYGCSSSRRHRGPPFMGVILGFLGCRIPFLASKPSYLRSPPSWDFGLSCVIKTTDNLFVVVFTPFGVGQFWERQTHFKNVVFDPLILGFVESQNSALDALWRERFDADDLGLASLKLSLGKAKCCGGFLGGGLPRGPPSYFSAMGEGGPWMGSDKFLTSGSEPEFGREKEDKMWNDQLHSYPL